MAKLSLNYTKVRQKEGYLEAVTSEDIKRFNPDLLGLGKMQRKAPYLEALAAIFDLSGFTPFCNQYEPTLVVPEFVSRFISWIFTTIKAEFTQKETRKRVVLFNRMPFFAKFLGDGILFLWDTDAIQDDYMLGNIVIGLFSICNLYTTQFLPSISGEIDNPPKGLRCGIARGQVIQIGQGNDYVGVCINLASRLQKISPELSFAFPRKGFDPMRIFNSVGRKGFIAKKAPIRGIGEKELVQISKKEFASLPPKLKKEFERP